MMNRQGRPSGISDATSGDAVQTFSGNRGLDREEALIFEIGTPRRTGVDFPECEPFTSALGGLERNADIGVPGLTEPETVRHYTRLSKQNYAIDTGLYPLGPAQ